MHFGVLGPVVVSGPSGAVDVGGPRQRRLLAALIANVNEIVSTDRLIDIVFEGDPPEGAVTTIRSYVARLRRALPGDQPGPLFTEAPGYVLRLSRDELDVSQFIDGLETGRRRLADHDAVAAVATLREALGWWRGPPYDEFTYEEWVRPEVLRLEEFRIVAAEELVEAQLACGMAEEVVADLRRLVDQHPLRDRMRSQLMVALYRAGRQPEALRSFEDHRRALIEVGLEPSAEMVALEQSIAVHDPALHLAAPAGRRLRGYRLGARLGEGRHGVVHRALQPGVGREVAVKAIRPELADDPSFIRRFDAEAQLVSRLEHPHVVPLYDFWREPGAAYMVMRLLPGSLGDRLEAGPLDPLESARLAEQIGSALSTAHRAGVVHGDIQPSNVLVDGDGNTYLSDFGVATLVGQEGDGLARPLSGYESPEQRAGEDPSPATDQFALAVLVARSLTGTLPFGTRAIASPHDRVPSVHVQRPSVPAQVDDVIWKATAWSPEDRYPDVAAFVAHLETAFGGSADVPDLLPADAANPYKGLRAFDESDWRDFFGRGRLIDELLARLEDDGEARFVTVVGASGSGKSSVVRAGLLPRLRAGALAGSEQWFVTTMVPGSDPFAELEMAMRSIAVDEPDTGRYDEEQVHRILRAAVPASQPVLLVIDQLEELFTAVTDERTRRSFLDGVARAVSDRDTDLRVVATLRADFFDRPLRYHDVGNLIKNGAVAVVGMSAAELEQAVREPAARLGVEVEPALATEIVAEVVDQPAALPLLQYTMTELFEHRRGRLITQESYRRMGGVGAAVARRADHVLERIPAAAHETVRKLFLRLISIDETGTVTRRRARRSELVSLAVDAGEADAILDAFGAARLLTFDRDPTTRQPTVEVAHEAMIHHWPRLSGWVEEAGDGLRVQTHLTEAAAAWDRQGRDTGDLYRGARLETATRWAGENPDAVNETEREFLDRSVELAEAERAAEQAHIERQRRSNRRLRSLLTIVGVTLIVAVVAGFVAVGQRNEARLQGQIATVRELVAASGSNLDVDPELSLLLALEAVNVMSQNGVYQAEAEQALHDALLADRLLFSARNHANGLAHLSPDDSSMIALTHPDESSIPQVWNVETLEVLFDLEGHTADVIDGVFSPDGSRIATTSMDGTVRLWDASTGELLSVLPMQVETCLDIGRLDCGPFIPAFSRDGARLAVGSAVGEVWIWDLVSEAVEHRLTPPADLPVLLGLNLEFSPDDTLLAVTYSEPIVGLWDTRTGALAATLAHDGEVSDLGFTPDGTKLVTAGGQVQIWDMATREVEASFTEHEAGVRDIEVSADGRMVASGGDADVLVWDLETLDVVHRVVGHSGDVDGIDLSRDGRLLLTGSWVDGTTRLWDLSPEGSHELVTFPGPGQGRRLPGVVSFAPDGRSLAFATGAGLITVREHPSGGEVFTDAAPGVATFVLRHSDDGSALVASGNEGVKVWDARSGREVWSFFDELPSFATISPDGQSVAVASRRGAEVWELPDGEPTPLVEAAPAQAVEYSPDASLIVVSGEGESGDLYLDVFDADTGGLLAELDVGLPEGEHIRPVTNLAFTPDGERMVSVSVDGAGVVWDTGTWEPVVRLEGHDSVIIGLAIDPTRGEVATASFDGTVRVWDIESGTVRLVFSDAAPLVGVSYSPDGKYLAVAGESLPVRVLMLELDELVAEAESRLTRTWTQAECAQYLHLAECPADPGIER